MSLTSQLPGTNKDTVLHSHGLVAIQFFVCQSAVRTQAIGLCWLWTKDSAEVAQLIRETITLWPEGSVLEGLLSKDKEKKAQAAMAAAVEKLSSIKNNAAKAKELIEANS